MLGFELREGQKSLARVERVCPKLRLTTLLLLPLPVFIYNYSPFLLTVIVSFPPNASCSMTRSSILLLSFVSSSEPSSRLHYLLLTSSVVVLRVRVGVTAFFFNTLHVEDRD